MVGGAGGAQRRHGIADAVLRQCDDVHVALHDQGVSLLADRAAGFEQAVQLSTLDEHRGFRGIQVFGLTLVQHPAAKTDDLPLDRSDREHDAVAESVVTPRLFRFTLRHEDQSRIREFRRVVLWECTCERSPPFGRIPEAEVLCDPTGQASAFEVIDGARGFPQALPIMTGRLFEDLGQRPALCAGLCIDRSLSRVDFRSGYLEAEALRQILQPFDETHARMLHQEPQRIPVGAAAEAVVELLGGADGEAR